MNKRKATAPFEHNLYEHKSVEDKLKDELPHELMHYESLVLTARQHAAKLIMALRDEQERSRQLDRDMNVYLARTLQMEASRSWKMTQPLRDANIVVFKIRLALIRIARKSWHRFVKYPMLTYLALVVALPIPRVRARLKKSITAHAQSATHRAQHEGPRPPIMIGREAGRILKSLETARLARGEE